LPGAIAGDDAGAIPREERAMGQPVVHFQVVGKDGDKLQAYYSQLFGWGHLIGLVKSAS
jgi:hypothetical protein